MKNGKFEKKDLDELNKFYKDNGEMTNEDFRNMVGEFIEWDDGDSGEDKESVEFWKVVQEAMQDHDTIFFYDDKYENAYRVIYDIVEDLHYDNGKPLIGDRYSYFDRYDRELELVAFCEDEVIDHFELDKDGNLIRVLEKTEDDVKELLTEMYDGASWDQDFGDVYGGNWR